MMTMNWQDKAMAATRGTKAWIDLDYSNASAAKMRGAIIKNEGKQ